MPAAAEPLPEDVDALQSELEQRRQEVHELRRELAWYQEQQRLARAKRYAASADTPPEQATLLDEAEREVHRERTHAVKGHKRQNKSGGGRAPLPDHLPREVRVHELGAEECACGDGMVRAPAPSAPIRGARVGPQLLGARAAQVHRRAKGAGRCAARG